jgi:hypothetical protein
MLMHLFLLRTFEVGQTENSKMFFHGSYIMINKNFLKMRNENKRGRIRRGM